MLSVCNRRITVKGSRGLVVNSKKIILHRVPACRASGFTIVEVLVVISVLAILTAILLPALGGVRQRAISLQCTVNMRSVVQVLMLYSGDYRGFLPFGGWEEHVVSAPDGQEYRNGGVDGVAKGRWSLLLTDEWSGSDWDPGLWCSRQPRHDPEVPYGGTSWATDGHLQLPMYSMSRAFWLDPRSLRLGVPWPKQVVRPARVGDVLFPSEKSLLYEEIAFCIFGRDAEWSINQWAQTPYDPTSVAAMDGSVIRMPRADGLPGMFSWPFDATVRGVHGMDIPRSSRRPSGK